MKTQNHVRSFPLMMVVLTIMRGILGTQYRIFANCDETTQVRAKNDNIPKTEIFFSKYWHLKHSSSLKIDRLTAIFSSNLKWVGQA